MINALSLDRNMVLLMCNLGGDSWRLMWRVTLPSIQSRCKGTTNLQIVQRNLHSMPLPSGVYIYKLTFDSHTVTTKGLLLKLDFDRLCLTMRWHFTKINSSK